MSAPVMVWGALVVITLALFTVLSFQIVVRGWGELREMFRALQSALNDRPASTEAGTSEGPVRTTGPENGRPT